MKRKNKLIISLLGFLVLYHINAYAAPYNLQVPNVNISVDGSKSPKEYVDNVKLLLLLTSLTFIPAVVLLMTSFTRIIVVLGFVRNALSTPQIPPNQVLIGLALFMTLFIMTPVYKDVNNTAIQPYLKGKINQEQAIKIGEKPIKNFMLNQTRQENIALFYKIAKLNKPALRYDVPLRILVPAFV